MISRIDPAQNEFLAGLEARAKQPNPFFRVMAHRPKVLESFVPLYGAVMGAGPLDRRLKEMAYLATAMANHCPYCTASHKAGARKAGIIEDEMQAIEREENGGFSEVEQAVLTYARELTRTANLSTAARDRVGAYLSEEQIVELTLVVAMANFTNRFNNGLEILPEGQ